MAPIDQACEPRCGDGGSAAADEGSLSGGGRHRQREQLPSSERSSARTPPHRRGVASMIHAAAAVAILAVCSVPEAASMNLHRHGSAQTTLKAPDPPRSLRRGGLGRSAAFAGLSSTPVGLGWCGGITALGWGGASEKNPSLGRRCPRVRGGGRAAAGVRMQEQPVQGISELPKLKFPASRFHPASVPGFGRP